MKKLELKHVIPYVPHKLRFIADGEEWEMTGLDVTSEYTVWAGVRWDDEALDYIPTINGKQMPAKGTGFELKSINPILRPLSDIHKEIEHNGKKFIPVREIESIRKGLDIYKPLNLDYPIEIILETENYSQDIDLYDGYLIVQKLIEWHFDISSLIEKGWAIDINDLNKL